MQGFILLIINVQICIYLLFNIIDFPVLRISKTPLRNINSFLNYYTFISKLNLVEYS